MKRKHKKHHAQPAVPAATSAGPDSAPSRSEAPAPVAAAVRKPRVVTPRMASNLPAEEPEPRVGLAAAPIWLVVLLGVLFYWGTMYLDQNGGGFNAQVYEPFGSYQDVADANPIDPAVEEIKSGQKVFTANCSGCHQANGLGSPSQNWPPLAGSEWVLANGPNRIIRVALDGATGPITVKGQLFDGATMTPWRPTLTPEQIAHALTYVRKSWGNNAPRVDPEEVKKIKELTKDRSTAWTEKELLAIPEKDADSARPPGK